MPSGVRELTPQVRVSVAETSPDGVGLGARGQALSHRIVAADAAHLVDATVGAVVHAPPPGSGVPSGIVVSRRLLDAVGGLDHQCEPALRALDLAWRLALLGFGLAPADVVPDTALDPAVRGMDRLLAKHLTARHLRAMGLNEALAGGARPDVQARRYRSDGETLRLLGEAGLLPPGTPEAAALEAQLAPAALDRYRILVVTDDVIGERMAGPAIRAVHVARALAPDHDVTLVSTNPASPPRLGLGDIHAVVATSVDALAAEAEIVVCQGDVLNRNPVLVERNDVMAIVDLYDPIHLEQLELLASVPPQRSNHIVAESVRILGDQIRRGDFFVCATERQRDLWLGFLSALGRVNPRTYRRDDTLTTLLALAPFGISDDPPVRSGPALRGVIDGIGSDDEVVLWAGGIYDWFDPTTLIDAVARLRHHRPSIRLVFMGARHPNPDVPPMRKAAEAMERAAEHDLLDTHVFFVAGWVPYERRGDVLLEADVGVSSHELHLETAFSFRTRLLDYLWASLPVVVTGGDELGERTARSGAGIVVPPGDVDAWVRALDTVLGDPEVAARCRDSAALLANEFRWRRTLDPIVAFCRAPRRASDALPWAPGEPEPADTNQVPSRWTHVRRLRHIGGVRLAARRSLAKVRRVRHRRR